MREGELRRPGWPPQSERGAGRPPIGFVWRQIGFVRPRIGFVWRAKAFKINAQLASFGNFFFFPAAGCARPGRAPQPAGTAHLRLALLENALGIAWLDEQERGGDDRGPALYQLRAKKATRCRTEVPRSASDAGSSPMDLMSSGVGGEGRGRAWLVWGLGAAFYA